MIKGTEGYSLCHYKKFMTRKFPYYYTYFTERGNFKIPSNLIYRQKEEKTDLQIQINLKNHSIQSTYHYQFIRHYQKEKNILSNPLVIIHSTVRKQAKSYAHKFLVARLLLLTHPLLSLSLSPLTQNDCGTLLEHLGKCRTQIPFPIPANCPIQGTTSTIG